MGRGWEGEGVDAVSDVDDVTASAVFPRVRSDSSASSAAKNIPLELGLSPESPPPPRNAVNDNVSGRRDPLLNPPVIERKKKNTSELPVDEGGKPFSERFQSWLREGVWPGMGLFGESYLLFSIGTLKPIWKLLYPECFDGAICADALIHSLTYSVVIGVISGMIAIGTMANFIGRRAGSITTAAFMSLGSILMTAASFALASDPNSLFMAMSASLAIFGFGIGGEYPLSATLASERAMGAMRRRMREELEAEDRRRAEERAMDGDWVSASTPTRRGGSGWLLMGNRSNRSLTSSVAKRQGKQADEEEGEIAEKRREGRVRGRTVLLVFTMQGMGIFINSLTITFLLLITNQLGRTSNGAQRHLASTSASGIAGTYDLNLLLLIWRIVYCIGAIILSFVLIYRFLHLQESNVWADDRARRQRIMRERGHRQKTVTTGGATSAAAGSFVPPKLPPQQPASNSVTAAQLAAPVKNESSVSSDEQKTYPLNTVSTLSSLSVPSEIEQLSPIRNVPSTTSEQDISSSSFRLLLRNFGWRLVGTSMTWLLWDVAFYGNKLFQSSFLVALTGENTTLFELSGAATLNSLVALLGYFAAAFIVDSPFVGRLRLQQYGFLITGSFFVSCGFLKDRLSSTTLILMYFGSSFFGQCGPNTTTFLIPAEIFPTEMRTMCHGISAASGKVGALIAAILFNYSDEVQLFLISGYASFAACILTFITIPETTTLDLYEIDRKWRMILDGRKAEYEGLANSPEHLSYYERVKAGVYY